MRIEFMVPPLPDVQRRMIAALVARQFQSMRRMGWIALTSGIVAVLAYAAGLRSTLILVCGAALVFLGVSSLTAPGRVTARLMRQNQVVYEQICSYEITDDAVACSSGVGASSLRWAAVTSVDETPEFWVVRVGTHHGMVVPRRFIASEQEAEARSFLVRKAFVTP